MTYSDPKHLAGLRDRFHRGRIDRRTFLSGLAAGCAAAGLVSVRGARKAYAQVTELRFDTWGGTVSEAFRLHAFPGFTSKTGINVVEGTLSDSHEYFARVKASAPGEYHMFHGSGHFDYNRYVQNGLSVQLDEANIPNLSLVMDKLVQPLRKLSGGTLSGVPYNYGSTGLAYNRRYVSQEEMEAKGAKILSDPAMRGKVAIHDDWITRVWYAALATGQDPNAVQDENAIWENLRQQRDTAVKLWASGAESMNLLASEEVYVCDAWSGRVASLQQEGADIGWYDPPGSYGWQDYMMVIAGAPKEACEMLINFLLEPETANAVAEAQNYAPSLDPTKVSLSDKVKSLPNFDPTGALADLTFDDAAYWAGKEASWAEAYGRIIKGG